MINQIGKWFEWCRKYFLIKSLAGDRQRAENFQWLEVNFRIDLLKATALPTTTYTQPLPSQVGIWVLICDKQILNRACTKKTVNACHHGSSHVSGASKSDMARLNQVMLFAIICHPILSLEKWFKNYWHFNEAWIDFPNVKIGLHFAQANCTTCAPRVHHVCTTCAPMHNLLKLFASQINGYVNYIFRD